MAPDRDVLSPSGVDARLSIQERKECRMKATMSTGCLIVVASLLLQLVAADPPDAKAEKQEAVVPKFVVYSSAEDAEFRTSVFRVLRGVDKVAQIAKVDTIEKATESEVDVLVK